MTPTTKAALDAAENLLRRFRNYIVELAEPRVDLAADALHLIAEARKAEESDTARQEADQNAALVGELREALQAVLDHVEDETAPREGMQCTLCNNYRNGVIRPALALTPPAALERVQREAAAKEIETTMERWHEMPFPEYVSKRAAELREGK